MVAINDNDDDAGADDGGTDKSAIPNECVPFAARHGPLSAQVGMNSREATSCRGAMFTSTSGEPIRGWRCVPRQPEVTRGRGAAAQAPPPTASPRPLPGPGYGAPVHTLQNERSPPRVIDKMVPGVTLTGTALTRTDLYA